jgi:hypothetical protein
VTVPGEDEATVGSNCGCCVWKGKKRRREAWTRKRKRKKKEAIRSSWLEQEEQGDFWRRREVGVEDTDRRPVSWLIESFQEHDPNYFLCSKERARSTTRSISPSTSRCVPFASETYGTSTQREEDDEEGEGGAIESEERRVGEANDLEWDFKSSRESLSTGMSKCSTDLKKERLDERFQENGEGKRTNTL